MGRTKDPIVDFFKSKMEEHKLVDIIPNVLSPTWLNGSFGASSLSKRLDRFLMVEDLCDEFGKYRTWYHSLGFSDHKAIILQLDFDKSLTFFSL